MNKQFIFLPMAFMVILFSLDSCSTYLPLKEGNLNFLDNQYKLKLVYDYSGMEVAADQKENIYLDSMVKEINMKDSGRGELWRRKWFSDRNEKFHPAFEQELSNFIYKVSLSADTANLDAKYAMTMKFIYTNPGAMTEESSEKPKMIVDVIFTEIQHPEKVLAKIELQEITGSNYTTDGSRTYTSHSGSNMSNSRSYTIGVSSKITDYNSSFRLIPCYRSMGTTLGKSLQNYLNR